MVRNLDAAQAVLALARPLSPMMGYATVSALDLTLASACSIHLGFLVQVLHLTDCKHQADSQRVCLATMKQRFDIPATCNMCECRPSVSSRATLAYAMLANGSNTAWQDKVEE